MKRALVVCVVAFAFSSLGIGACVDLKPGRCNGDGDCPAGTRCDLDPTPQGNGRCVAKGTDGGDAGPDADGGIETSDDGPSDQMEAAAEAPVACTAASCTGATPICDGTSKVCRACGAGPECVARSAATPVCAASGACVECSNSSQCGVSSKPICEANVCRTCTSGADCTARDPKLPACVTSGASSGTCVECTGNADCKLAGKPVCNAPTNTCRPCKADSECPADPGVCMEDGHCATAGEVIFVEYNDAGCTGAEGSSGKPYCLPNEGVAALTNERHVIVIRGAAGERMSVATSGKSPVIIGRKSVTGDIGAIPAGASVALTVSSDDVRVRDLSLTGGIASGSKGLLATGTSTKVTLVRVSVALGMGVGLETANGASLTIDQCAVQNNSTGGIYINGPNYNIQNTVIVGNGFGVRFSSVPTSASSQFRFNTVVAGAGGAITCDPVNAQTVAESIVVGFNDSCTLANSITTAPTFSVAKPFHLTTHLACPAAPTTFPDHDIDGDPRVAPIDCGADQYVP